jgi:hypothetical protein
MSKPLAIDLFSGLGGWTEGLLAEGYDVVGFDIERHVYGEQRYPAQLVLQDVMTIHGSQFRNAALIVASPPCQEFSYMAMPWKRAKQIAAALCEEVPFPEGYTGSRTVTQLRALFDSCFRIQREASEAAGHHIPMVVENVKGAQPWVGRAKANFGSFYLWGDVAMVGNRIVLPQPEFGAEHTRAYRALKIEGYSDPRRNGGKGAHLTCQAENDIRAGRKVPMNFHEHEKTGKPERSFQSAAVEELIESASGTKQAGISGTRANGKGSAWFAQGIAHLSSGSKNGKDWFGSGENRSLQRRASSRSSARKAASAQIAKIPLELSRWVARSYWPTHAARRSDPLGVPGPNPQEQPSDTALQL